MKIQKNFARKCRKCGRNEFICPVCKKFLGCDHKIECWFESVEYSKKLLKDIEKDPIFSLLA